MIPPNRPNLILAAACLASLSLLSGCIVQVTEKLGPDGAPRPVQELGLWQVELDGREVGRVKRIRIEDPVQPKELYKVEHADGQHAGWIDLSGRAWRDEPFHREMVLVGMDSMAASVRDLLDLRRLPELRSR
jgi:hypothetical protein